MIENSEESGASEIDMRRNLRELGAREMALATPNPRTQANPSSHNRTGRSPAVTIAWPTPLYASRNAVHYLTAGA